MDSQSSLLGCLQNEFSDQVAQEIYTKLTDEEIDDLQTLILTDDKDLDRSHAYSRFRILHFLIRLSHVQNAKSK